MSRYLADMKESRQSTQAKHHVSAVNRISCHVAQCPSGLLSDVLVCRQQQPNEYGNCSYGST
jgi:hypothetical protein